MDCTTVVQTMISVMRNPELFSPEWQVRLRRHYLPTNQKQGSYGYVAGNATLRCSQRVDSLFCRTYTLNTVGLHEGSSLLTRVVLLCYWVILVQCVDDLFDPSLRGLVLVGLVGKSDVLGCECCDLSRRHAMIYHQQPTSE